MSTLWLVTQSDDSSFPRVPVSLTPTQAVAIDGSGRRWWLHSGRPFRDGDGEVDFDRSDPLVLVAHQSASRRRAPTSPNAATPSRASRA
jgi:hypothetical protein